MTTKRIVAALGILALAAGVWVACNAGESSSPAAPGVAALGSGEAAGSPESNSGGILSTPRAQRWLASRRAYWEGMGKSEAEIERGLARDKERLIAYFDRGERPDPAQIQATIAGVRAVLNDAREVGESASADRIEAQLEHMAAKEGLSQPPPRPIRPPSGR